MFTDTPFLSTFAADRHRELVAEADQFRLARLARARPAPRPLDPDRTPPSAPPRVPETAEECRTLVPR